MKFLNEFFKKGIANMAHVEKGKQLYEGKAKKIHETSDPKLIIQYFKDDATAFNAEKKGTIQNKGVMNNKISSHLFKYLERNKIPTHFVEHLSDREMLCRKLTILPLEVVLRNVVAGSLSKRTGIEEGKVLGKPILEYFYKDDALGDPMINRNHILVFEWATEAQLKQIEDYGYQINSLLKNFFENIGIRLVDFKLEFGVDAQGKLFLADEITPDGCRLWDMKTNEKLDKDRFRRDLGKIEESYERVLKAVTEVNL